MCRAYRSIIARLRNGSFTLNIELGRYRNIPLELRICRTCNSNAVESEVHFLCNCPAYDFERNDLYNKINAILAINMNQLSSVEKIKIMLSNKLVTKHVCAFVNAASVLRNIP